MRIKWVCNETRVLPQIGVASPGDELEVPDATGASYIEQGLAQAIIAKASKKTITEETD